MSWDAQLTRLMDNSCMKYGAIFDHHGQSIAATPGFTLSADEVEKCRAVIVANDTSVFATGITLNNEQFAVVRFEIEKKVLLLKAKKKEGKEPLSGCVALCPTVIIVGISNDGGATGAGASSVISLAEHINMYT